MEPREGGDETGAPPLLRERDSHRLLLPNRVFICLKAKFIKHHRTWSLLEGELGECVTADPWSPTPPPPPSLGALFASLNAAASSMSGAGASCPVRRGQARCCAGECCWASYSSASVGAGLWQTLWANQRCGCLALGVCLMRRTHRGTRSRTRQSPTLGAGATRPSWSPFHRSGTIGVPRRCTTSSRESGCPNTCEPCAQRAHNGTSYCDAARPGFPIGCLLGLCSRTTRGTRTVCMTTVSSSRMSARSSPE
jgi:hypothetical protein